MDKEEIDRFYDEFGVKKAKKIENKFQRFWENPPIPEGMKLIFRCY